VSRKLIALRKKAAKEIDRTHAYLSKNTGWYSKKAKLEIEQAKHELQSVMETENPSELSRSIKNYKATVDLFHPIHHKSSVRETIEAVVIALILALFIRHFVIQAFKIPSGSMIPTLLVGDKIIVSKFIYGMKVPFQDKKFFVLSKPKRGDIIVFKWPKDPTKDFIKRVVGLPGDDIVISSDGLWINGNPIDREFVGQYDYTDNSGIPTQSTLFNETLEAKEHMMLIDGKDQGYIPGIGPVKNTFKVPQGQYFVMGDNRDRSNDSRFWGTVDFNLIRGKAMVIYFSWPPKQLTRFGKILK
jgi:signal peptidase I